MAINVSALAGAARSPHTPPCFLERRQGRVGLGAETSSALATPPPRRRRRARLAAAPALVHAGYQLNFNHNDWVKVPRHQASLTMVRRGGGQGAKCTPARTHARTHPHTHTPTHTPTHPPTPPARL